ncbi:hypothetical protein MHU86_20015 [Fragilaria crotonensis]|nr:hypothetical protein MHU86_20015 [Fragilaria crotonensis]
MPKKPPSRKANLVSGIATFGAVRVAPSSNIFGAAAVRLLVFSSLRTSKCLSKSTTFVILIQAKNAFIGNVALDERLTVIMIAFDDSIQTLDDNNKAQLM